MFADLHCHTNISDHSESTETVIRLAKASGVQFLAITNHDTTQGLSEAVRIGQQVGVNVIPGIEISAEDRKRGGRAHLLGLFVPPEHKGLNAFCAPTLAARHTASHKAVEVMEAGGLPVNWELVQSYAASSTAVYKQHIMHALVDLKAADAIHGETYKRWFSGAEAPAYFPIGYVDIVEAIREVREAGGLPVIAHPGQLNNWDAIPEWAEAGLGGIEVYHPDHKPQDVARALALAEAHQLLVTGGTDHHGMYGRPDYRIGDFGIPQAQFERLLRWKEQRSSFGQ